jgi:hypothetical protein
MKRLLITLLFAVPINSFAQQPQNGYELIRQMYNANKSNWYQTLCFAQEIFYYSNDSIVNTDIMFEAYSSPGNLILKFTDWDSGNGMLFTRDTLYSFHKGNLISSKYRIHDLVVLGLDINNIPPEITASRAEKCGYNLDLIGECRCMGYNAWFVGDTTTNCFWVDKTTLLFIKMRRRIGENSREVEFAKYENINGFPVATVINFYNNEGELSMVEKYFNINPDCDLPSSIYNPLEFKQSRW